jgi:hypothetical protein
MPLSVSAGDVVTLSPGVGDFPNGVFTAYLVSGSARLARVAFVSQLLSIAVTPNAPGVPVGLTQQFKATGTFSDTSSADLTASVAWTSGTLSVATVGANSGLATASAVGSTLVTATSGSVSGSATLSVLPPILESIAITPDPVVSGINFNMQLTATGSYSDGSMQNVTTQAVWSSNTPGVATIGPATGLTTGVIVGSATISAAIGTVTAIAPLSVITNAWFPTGSMATGRAYHTATLLSSGMVLAVGGGYTECGTYCVTVPSSVVTELYNPSVGAWTATGSLTTARYLHTATLLPNGKVLVAGGFGDSGYIAGAEIYDPAAGSWTVTGSMTTVRAGHSATLLPSGMVLATGGDAPSSQQSLFPISLASAEVYDPL